MNKNQLLKNYLYKYKYKLMILVLLNLILLGINLVNTFITSKYLDLLVYKTSIETIYLFTFILFILGISGILIGNINNYISTKTQANMVFDINFEVLKYVKKVPIKFFNNIDSVYLNQRINADSNTLVNFLSSITIHLIPQIIIFIVSIWILKDKNMTVSIVILSSIPLYLILYSLFEKFLYKATLDYKEKQNEFFANMNKHLNNISFIKLNVLFDKLDEDLLDSYPMFLKSLIKYIRCNYCFSSIGSMLDNIFNVFLFLYGGIEILKGKITIGDFIFIKSYYLMLLGTVANMTSILKSYPEALVCFNRIIEILKTNQEDNGEETLNHISNIKLRNLSLKLNQSKILDNINFEFHKGKVYLLKGYNGAGKSSLVKSILGLYINDFDGDIIYNNLNIKNINLYNLRKTKVAILDQEPLLIYSDILKNLTHDVKNFDINKLEQLIEDFDLTYLYKKEKEVNDLRNISGGEKQKISLIRTFIRDADVIIMDEPTSALDIKSIEILKSKIEEIREEKIIIIISHDEKLNEIADIVIKIENKKIINEINTGNKFIEKNKA